MKLFYYEAKNGNFGDDLNEWLWPRLLGGRIDGTGELLVGIGTILDRRIPVGPARKIVFGTGIRRVRDVPALDSTWDVRFVRGPISASAMGLPEVMAITDPAIALALLEWPPSEKKYETSLVPHYLTATEFDCGALADRAGLHLIDPRWSVERVIGEIRASRRVITEAMHGAIAADTFRVPWVRVNLHRFHAAGDVFALKWLDWGLSLGLDVTPYPTTSLPPRKNGRVARLARPLVTVMRLRSLGVELRILAGREDFSTSDDDRFRIALEKVEKEVARLRDDPSRGSFD